MSRVALTYILRPGRASAVYAGKMKFGADLKVGLANSYIHERRRHIVRVVRIEPVSWNAGSEIVPTVYVAALLSNLEWKEPSVPRRSRRRPGQAND